MGSEGLRSVAITILALTPPAVAMFRHLGRGLRLTERFLLGLALAPFALALPALALALLGKAIASFIQKYPGSPLAPFADLPVEQCLLPVEFLWLVVAVWPRSEPAVVPPAEPLPERGQGFPAIAAIATAVGAALLIAAVALSGLFVRMAGDAWFHAAAALEIAIRGVPPQDPSFAGVAFYHPWFFHFMIVLLGSAIGASPFDEMALVNVWAAVVLVLAAAQLTYRAFGRAAAMWVGAIVMLGLDPFGWAFAILKVVAGRSTGLANTIAEFGTGSGAMNMLSYRFPPSHVSLLNRFWTGTPLTPAIALGVATAWSVARALERPSRAASLRTLVLALATFALHPAYAAIALAGLGTGIVWAALTGERRMAAISLLATLALAFAAGIPYLWASSPPGGITAVRFGFFQPNLWSLVLAVGPWWVIAAPAFGPARGGGAAPRFCAAAALVAVASALVIVWPEVDSDKLFYLVWVSLAPLVGGGWVWWADRLRLPTVARLTLVAGLIVPTAGLYTIGTAMDPSPASLLIRGEAAATRHLPLATLGEGEAYAVLREILPEDAVVIEKRRPTVNEPLPVLSKRRVFCGSLDVYLADQHDAARVGSRARMALMEEFRIRRDIQDALFESGVLDDTQYQYLAGFSETVYLLVRRSEVPDRLWFGFMAQPIWAEEFGNREVRIYRLRKTTPGASGD
jgi:hypothetical protein